MRSSLLRCLAASTLCTTATFAASASLPVALQVDGRSGWVVTDDPAPRLTWTPTAALPGLTGWRLQVTRTDAPGEKKEWQIPAAQGPWQVLADLALPSRARYSWRVEPVFAPGNSSAVSAAEGRFETGLKQATDWHAQWIGLDEKIRGRSAPLFRKEFTLTKPVAHARLYVSGLGWHEAHLNGQLLGDDVLSPAQTDYEKRIFYVVHDVTALLKTGDNTLGAWVGDGWFNQDRVWGPKGLSYGQPRLRAQLEITHSDGTTTEIITDGSWSAAPSAITSTNVYQGEEFDARRHAADWATPGFAATNWHPVIVLPAPGGRMVAEEIAPCERQQRLPIKTWKEPKPGVHLADFGQNFTGWAKLRVRATPGTKITLRFAESIATDGTLDPTSTGIQHTKQVQTDVYVCHGQGEETWEPRFTFHAFQYADLTVSDGKLLSALDTSTLEGVAVYSVMPVRGEFVCSDPVIQRLFELADWTLIGNMQGLPTDCPGRERCGWTGDAHLLAPFALHRYHGDSLWNKYYNDILTSAATEGKMLTFGENFGERKQGFKPAGLPTMIAPGKRTSGAASPDWGSAIIFIPWDIYRFTGDTRILERNYGSFVQWVEHLRGIAVDHIVRNGLGDWCTPWRAGGPRPSEPRDYYGRIVPELSTACYWRSTDILARAAQRLGRTEDATRYRQLADDIAAAYIKKFYDPARGGFGDQTINAIAVNWGLLPAAQRAPVAAYLAAQIKESGDHFYTGVFGLTSLFHTLGDYGHDATISRLFANPAAPGFRYLLAQGATTLWEVWPMPSDEGKPYERSKSHPFQGAWASWCYEGIAGIRADADTPGFQRLRLAPQMIRELTWARAREHTAMGWVESSWRRKDATLTWTVEIPPGAQATLVPPGKITALRALDQAAKSSPVTLSADALPAGRYEVSVALAASPAKN